MNNHEMMAFQQLQQISFNKSFIPATIMSMSFTHLLHIINDIIINERKNIIEFGSGISTIYIAKLLKDTEIDCNFYSVDISIDWINKMKQILQKESLLENVTFIEAGLKEVPEQFRYKNQTKWFDTKALNSILENKENFDLIIVDGPHGWACPYARYSAVPFMRNKLNDYAAVFLDDTERPHEKEIANEWKSILEMDLTEYKTYSVLTKSKSFNAEPFFYKRGPHYF
jgi:hypothetical protein